MIIRLVEKLSLHLARRYESAAFTEQENEALSRADLMISEGMLEFVDAPTSEG